MRAQQRGRWWCSGRRRRRWRPTSTPSRGRYELLTLERRVLDRPLAAGAASSTCGRSSPRTGRTRCSVARSPRQSAARLDRARAGAAAAEPARVRDGGVLPAVRRHAGVPELQRVARRARPRSRRVVPLLQLLERVPRTCPSCAAPYLEQMGFGTERVEAEVRAGVPARRASRGSIATPCAGAARWPTCWPVRRAAASTCWSARR